MRAEEEEESVRQSEGPNCATYGEQNRQLRRTSRTWTRLRTTADTERRPASMPQSPRQSRLLYSILDLILFLTALAHLTDHRK